MILSGVETRNYTRAEELDAVRRAKAGDAKARQEVLTRHLPLVFRAAWRCQSSGLDFDEAVSEGTIGLTRAFESFDPDSGYRFMSYAQAWIRLTLCTWQKSERRARREVLYGAVSDATFGGPFTDPECDVPDAPDTSPSPESEAAAKQGAQHAWFQAHTMLRRLNPTEQYIIKQRLMAEDPTPLRVLGEELGISRQKVAEIERAAVEKLRGGSNEGHL